MNTFKIYEELSRTLGDEAAKSLASLLGGMYEELSNSVTKEDFRELKAVVAELTEAQNRTEKRLDSLTLKVEELAEAQNRTEKRLEELAEAQIRTEKRLVELAEAQVRTEKRLDETNRQLGGLSATVGYTLENEAYQYLPPLLRRDFGIELEEPLRRGFLNDKNGRAIEVNILGRARRNGDRVLLIGESKAQLSRKKVSDYLEKVAPKIDTGDNEPFVVIVAHMETEPGVREFAREHGAAVYFSYEFRQPAA